MKAYVCSKCGKEEKQTRSLQQNRALHLYFSFISNELNELGVEYRYFGLKGQVLETRYTCELVKNFVWRPIQIALFSKRSTTKLTTVEMNEIIDVITKFFAEKSITLNFPNIETLMNENHFDN